MSRREKLKRDEGVRKRLGREEWASEMKRGADGSGRERGGGGRSGCGPVRVLMGVDAEEAGEGGVDAEEAEEG